MVDMNINSCVCCGKQITKNETIRKIICLDCMANIVKNINIEPNKHYSDYIDFAYSAKNRLENGEDASKIMENAPEGFDVWLKKNSSLSGYGIISD
ncbi:MAG: hypothetical protein LN408_00135 [Candidatus Thermoplasmatota archaeon]|jgi:hypothetical protein|nr:hypothetical protein [Candidatus Thermoplasmatota archaeon]